MGQEDGGVDLSHAAGDRVSGSKVTGQTGNISQPSLFLTLKGRTRLPLEDLPRQSRTDSKFYFYSK